MLTDFPEFVYVDVTHYICVCSAHTIAKSFLLQAVRIHQPRTGYAKY